MKQELSTDKNDLLRCEAIIKRNQESFVETAMALAEIRDRKLYAVDGYKNFDTYCQKVWGWGERRARQIMNSASVVQGLTGKTGTTVPVSERVARAVGQVEPKDRPRVLAIAKKNTGGKVTARSVAEAAKEIKEEEKKVEGVTEKTIIRDQIGCEIPEECHPVWNRRQEIQDLMTQVTRLKSALKKAREDDDPLFRDLENHVETHLDGLYHCISKIKPYAVCLHCQGHPTINKTPCSVCRGRGIVPKFVYEFPNDDRLRKVREMSIKK